MWTFAFAMASFSSVRWPVVVELENQLEEVFVECSAAR
jgi:hypothetical protein